MFPSYSKCSPAPPVVPAGFLRSAGTQSPATVWILLEKSFQQKKKGFSNISKGSRVMKV